MTGGRERAFGGARGREDGGIGLRFEVWKLEYYSQLSWFKEAHSSDSASRSSFEGSKGEAACRKLPQTPALRPRFPALRTTPTMRRISIALLVAVLLAACVLAASAEQEGGLEKRAVTKYVRAATWWVTTQEAMRGAKVC